MGLSLLVEPKVVDALLNKELSPNFQESQESHGVREKIEKIIGEGSPFIISPYIISSLEGNLQEIIFGTEIIQYPRFLSLQKTKRERPNSNFSPYESAYSIKDPFFNMRGVAKVEGGDYLISGIYYPNPNSSQIKVLLVGRNGQVVYQAELTRGKNYDNATIIPTQIASVSLGDANYYFLPVDNHFGLPVFIKRGNTKEARVIPVENARIMSFQGLRAMSNGGMIDVFVNGFQDKFYGIRVNPNNLNQSTTRITPIAVDDFCISRVGGDRFFYGISEPTLEIITGRIDNDNGITGVKRYELPREVSHSVGEISGIVAVDNDKVATCRSEGELYDEGNGQLVRRIFVDFYSLPPNSSTLILESSIPIIKTPYDPETPLLGISAFKIDTANIDGQKVLVLSTLFFGAHVVSYNPNNLNDPNQLSAYPINGAGLGGHHLYLPTVKKRT